MALVVTRKNGQSIFVDGCATITIYSSTAVRVAIDAPRETNVVRTELMDKEKGHGRGAVQQQLHAVQR